MLKAAQKQITPTAQHLVYARLIILILSCAIFLFACQVVADEAALAELEIHNTFKPEICDRKARTTDYLTLHYNGTLEDGKQFDSSYARNEPITFQIGIGHVIPGWEKGLIGVCVGEKLKLVVPPHLGYGDAKHDQIPPNSTLTFEIEVLKIEDGPKPTNVFKEIDVNKDNRLSQREVDDYLKKQLPQNGEYIDGEMDHNRMVDEIFEHEDKDKDGYITYEEFSGPKQDHDEL